MDSPMAGKRRAEIREADLCGFKYFKVLGPLLERLHDEATQRDKACNRQLHFDQYVTLLLLYFFNPIVTGLRSIQQASKLDKVQKLFGCQGTSLGSLSAASRDFSAERLYPIIAELTQQLHPLLKGREAEALRGLTAVDGSLLPALPRMIWALWVDGQHRAAKMHVHFDVLRGAPVDVRVTAGNASETAQLRVMLQPHRLYVIDRGYADYQLFQDIINADSGFIGRIRENAVWTVIEERPLSAVAQAAGVRSDRLVWLGCRTTAEFLRQPLRIVEVHTGKTDALGRPEVLLLATTCLDLDADLVALAYRYRWSIELFFRWFKCILGCKHLLANSRNGVTIQVYLGMIASLLITLWTGKKPTKRTWEMLQFYFAGWATLDEVQEHIHQLKDQPA
jgi:Transposase DDE domain